MWVWWLDDIASSFLKVKTALKVRNTEPEKVTRSVERSFHSKGETHLQLQEVWKVSETEGDDLANYFEVRELS